MFQLQDPSIKLFGTNIHTHIPIQHSQYINITMNGYEEPSKSEMNVPLKKVSGEHTDPLEYAKDIPNTNESPTPELVSKLVHGTNEGKAAKRYIDEKEKVLKKPDKVLPCPRCNSLETKFCYFNNYNVNQPRHFCKNCQRYWTAGGTIRNVPVGAGKRKNKPSDLQYCQEPVAPDAVSSIQPDTNLASNAHLSSRPFNEMRNIHGPGEDAPLSESFETVLNLEGQKKVEVDTSTLKDDGEEPSSSSMRSAESCEKQYSESRVEQVGLTQQCNVVTPLHPLHYYSVPPWPYQWNPCWNAVTFRPSNVTSSPAYLSSETMMAVPGFSIPTVELPVAPSLYWLVEESSLVGVGGSTISGIPSPSSSVSNSACSGNRSPTLGKHCRDGSTTGDDTTKSNLWVPKTVRINDANEAAKSSIWSTLVTKSEDSEQNKPIIKGSVFKSFEPKSNADSRILDDNQILKANPAAFSRSESFQESM
ncbi:hypothetical protein Lal_00028941 [Lupinus albus]|uniref:Putative transcription factor C2C2-Dof family n=1 Tax=Lupinus albus TaxID=3870 RepID=A0A6A5NPM6_LUPAL|nr:putative transcription factor C2C2-Dof family [Lupinus albus]KAF1885052.1 hypothetical protein Lal_00028941 [Lupinus albus]